MVVRIASGRRALGITFLGIGLLAWAAAEARASWPHLHLRGASACHQPPCPPAGVVPEHPAPACSSFLVLRYDAATGSYVLDGSHRDMAAAQARALEIIAKGVAAVVLCEA